MNLTSLFCAVTAGRFQSANGRFLWVCPVCDDHVEAHESALDRDRGALLHYVHHRDPAFSGERIAASSVPRRWIEA